VGGEPVVIREFKYEHEALLAQAELEAEGIPSVILRTSLSDIVLAPPVRLAVRADSVAAALECLGRGGAER
jgi:hypothetical protein